MEAQHHTFKRITFDPDKCFGKACIRGMRMPVSSLLGYLSSGMTVEEILSEWPELASALEERIVPLEEPALS
jgi:uncharacterized protein (DUF433 family)